LILSVSEDGSAVTQTVLLQNEEQLMARTGPV